ncbi:MAG: hypothetical protein KatS3mg077_1544 [Candidatus Binatia bacterium]|nr:MAG: hypothetical protein KatS3mg077_1534 [Candidatus Binatia bacterium]GIW44262.1 MAG: hypothetical protein KatS3mg077_1544 [Candidatus Binatia bacterium]
MSRLVVVASATLVYVLGSVSARAAWFTHPCHGYKVWYPEGWYVSPLSEPPDCRRFAAEEWPPDDPRYGGGRDPMPEGYAGIALEVHESTNSCRARLEEETNLGPQWKTWGEENIGGRHYLTVRHPDADLERRLACWSDGHRQYVFMLSVVAPYPRYKELLATWEKVIASLELPAQASATPPPPTP